MESYECMDFMERLEWKDMVFGWYWMELLMNDWMMIWTCYGNKSKID